jgi:hypothetical protein
VCCDFTGTFGVNVFTTDALAARNGASEELTLVQPKLSAWSITWLRCQGG